jgi:hypothetical protein
VNLRFFSGLTIEEAAAAGADRLEKELRELLAERKKRRL